jgi:hypothetical protein
MGRLTRTFGTMVALPEICMIFVTIYHGIVLYTMAQGDGILDAKSTSVQSMKITSDNVYGSVSYSV